jgi:hypothetical protein
MALATPPNHAYFRANHGRWHSRFAFEIVDWHAFRRCPMSWLDRLRALSMVSIAKLLGALELETSVDYHGEGAHDVVIHATRVSKLGMTCFRSVERLTLHANGRDLTLAGEQYLWPTLWRARDFGGSGQVDETGTCAGYDFAFLGTRMRQSTRIEADGLRLLQETPWSRGLQYLRRSESPAD